MSPTPSIITPMLRARVGSLRHDTHRRRLRRLLTLAVPRSGTRPTSDRVREAIFSALDARDEIRGAHVLDLYAGTGALGLEAASRGAASVVLVERNAAAAAICRQNAEAVLRTAPAGGEAPHHRRGAAGAHYLEGVVGDFDLVFIDPPYDLAERRARPQLVALLVHRLSPRTRPSWSSAAPAPPEPTCPHGLALDRREEVRRHHALVGTAATATRQDRASSLGRLRPARPT